MSTRPGAADLPPDLASFQTALGLHLRSPRQHPRPTGLNARRTAVYSGLVFNNIEGCLAAAMPVCKLMLGRRWPRLVRAFCLNWRSHSPVFHELSGEFVQWLVQPAPDTPDTPKLPWPPWLPALAHYEWAELAVETMDTGPISGWHLPENPVHTNTRVQRNPALIQAQYPWPVHRIGPDFRPRRPQATGLLVYRDANDAVCFRVVNPVTARLVEVLSDPQPVAQACAQIALEMGRPDDPALMDAGLAEVRDLLVAQVLVHAA